MIIDNPGMREIQLLDANAGLQETFSEIENLSRSCKFKDCKHMSEPGCAVKSAIEEGTLSPERLENYSKLKREMRHLELKGSSPSPRTAEKAKWDELIEEANARDGIDHRERAKSKRKVSGSTKIF